MPETSFQCFWLLLWSKALLAKNAVFSKPDRYLIGSFIQSIAFVTCPSPFFQNSNEGISPWTLLPWQRSCHSEIDSRSQVLQVLTAISFITSLPFHLFDWLFPFRNGIFPHLLSQSIPPDLYLSTKRYQFWFASAIVSCKGEIFNPFSRIKILSKLFSSTPRGVELSFPFWSFAALDN